MSGEEWLLLRPLEVGLARQHSPDTSPEQLVVIAINTREGTFSFVLVPRPLHSKVLYRRGAYPE